MKVPSLQQVSSPGQLVGTKLRPKRGAPGSAPAFGMVMWFTVSVSNLDSAEPRSLGAWSACSGLEVTLTPEGPLEDGGNYSSPKYLPGRIGYKPVTLERVMTRAGTEQIRKWLNELADEWAAGKEAADLTYPDVTITLYDGSRAPLDTWRLTNAIPVSWSVPQFSTRGSGDFAIEKLVLQHSGFLEVTEQKAAKFELVGPDGKRLGFEYNPTKITISRSREASTGRTTLNAGDNVIDTNALSVDLNDLKLEGCSAVARANTLLRDWLEFVPGTATTSETPSETSSDTGAKSAAAAPPAAATEDKRACQVCHRALPEGDGSSPGKDKVLQVVWGKDRGGMPAGMVLRKFDMTITRFTADGRPSRATVNLKLQQSPWRRGRTPTTPRPRSERAQLGRHRPKKGSDE